MLGRPTNSTTADALLDRAAALRLLDPAQVDAARALLASFADPNAFLGELVRRGWLTPFQSERLLTGNGDELLLGSHVLLDKVGEGGMGSVFKARNWKLGRVVALKVIRPERQRDTSMRRFRREILASAQFDHPNIVRALDAEEHGDRLVLVMEYVEGVDLARLVREKGPLPVSQACDYVRQAAIALQHAHERGLVHRDIKPSNLFLTATGLKLLDFGLARSFDGVTEESGTMTETGMILGTPDYLAPEQAREAHDVDIRADLYSLGCTLYYLLTARPPFPGGSLTAKLLRHQNEDAPPVESFRGDVPPTILAVVGKLMAKDPADRYQTPAEVVAALAGLVVPVAQPIPTQPPSSPFAFDATLTEAANSVRAPEAAGPSRRRSLVLGALGVGIGLVIWILTIPPIPPSNPDPKEETLTPLQTQLRAFEKRVGEGGAGRETLREELLQFRRALPGPDGLLETAGLLARLPSPLDGIDASRIPASERLPGQPKELVAVLGSHAGIVGSATQAMAVGHDNRYVATGGEDRRVMLWDGETLQWLETLRMEASVTSASFAPNVARVAAASRNGNVLVWDVSTRPAKVLHQFVAGTGPAPVISLGPDAKILLVGGTEPGLRRWDLSGKEPRRLADVDTEGGPVHWLTQTPDGKRVAAGDPKALRVYDFQVEPPRRIHRIPAPDREFNSMALSLDGGTLGATNGALWCWRLADKGEPKVVAAGVDAHEGGMSIVFTPDGKSLATGGARGFLNMHDLIGDKTALRLNTYPRMTPAQLAFSLDGTILYGSDTMGRMQRFEHGRNKDLVQKPTVPAFRSPVLRLLFHQSDHRLHSSGYENQSRWNLREAVPVLVEQPARFWNWMAFAPNGIHWAVPHEKRLLAGAGAWEEKPEDRYTLPHREAISCAAFSPDSQRVVSGSLGGTVMLSFADNPSAGKPLAELGTHVWSVCFSPDGKQVAAGCGNPKQSVLEAGVIHFWDVESGTKVASLNVGPIAPDSTLSFTPDGRKLGILTRGSRGLILWKLGEDRGEIFLGTEAIGSARDFAFSPDGKWLAAFDDTPRVRLWKGKAEQGDLPLPEGTYPTRLAFAGDSRHLAVGLNIGATYILRLTSKPD